MPTARFNQELVSLISGALVELAHSQCPYGQACIGLDRYVEQNDIQAWLDRKRCAVKGVGEQKDYWSELALQRQLEGGKENVSTFNMERQYQLYGGEHPR